MPLDNFAIMPIKKAPAPSLLFCQRASWSLLRVGLLAAPLAACNAGPCALFVGDCAGSTIQIAVKDNTGAPLPVTSVTYSDGKTAPKAARCEASDCSVSRAVIPPEAADYTISVTTAMGSVSKAVSITTSDISDVSCCGLTIQKLIEIAVP